MNLSALCNIPRKILLIFLCDKLRQFSTMHIKKEILVGELVICGSMSFYDEIIE